MSARFVGENLADEGLERHRSAAARSLVRRLHRLTAGTPLAAGAEVVCHGDMSFVPMAANLAPRDRLGARLVGGWLLPCADDLSAPAGISAWPGGRRAAPEGDLHHLPLPDQHVNVVVCARACTHVPELAPVLTEFVRVLRPGGHLVISDSRGLLGYFGSPVVQSLPGGGFGYLPHRNRLTSDYLAAALPLGLRVRRCEEPRRPYPLIDPDAPPDSIPTDEPPDMWSLHSWCPAATNAAYRDNPAAIVWHFQLPAADSFPDHREGG